MSGQQMNLLLIKSLDALENCCFDPSLEHKYVGSLHNQCSESACYLQQALTAVVKCLQDLILSSFAECSVTARKKIFH